MPGAAAGGAGREPRALRGWEAPLAPLQPPPCESWEARGSRGPRCETQTPPSERAQEAQPRCAGPERRPAHPPRPQRRHGRGHREAHPSLAPAADSRPLAPAPSWGGGPGSTSTGSLYILPQNTLNSKGMRVSRLKHLFQKWT